MTTQFDRIFHGLSSEVGKFRVAASGMAWKGAESDGVVLMAANHIDWVQWLRVARNFQLRIGLKDEKREYRIEKFDGFMREDHDKLASLMKNHFGKTLETKEISFKGWNWGATDFQGSNLAFLVSDKTAFELPLDQVTNSNMAGRTEVSLEFSSLSSSTKPSAKAMGDEMVEIRFHVPGTHTKLKGTGSDDGSQVGDDDEEEISAAQVFHDMIKDRAVIGQEPGDLILSFEEVLVLTPRGRYDMDMYPEFLRLRGKTYDYKIDYSHISRMFLLPKDDQHVLFVVSLDLRTPGIGQGQTRYHYLVMQFSREEEITAELNMSDEDIAKYDKLKKNYEDPTFEVVSGVFRALAKKKIIGSGSFQSRDGHPGIKANLKATQGDMFLLEKYVFFVSKQPLLIEIADIHQVVFSRVGASMGAAAARTFDMKIVTKSGPEHNFTSINKEEHEPVETYLKDKKIKVKNEMIPDADLLLAATAGDDEDDDMQSVSSDDGPARIKPSRGAQDEDDSEEDEDFQASASDSGSPSESDSSGSGAATASDASGDRALTKAATKKKKAKGKGKETDGSKKAAKKKASNESDAEEDKPKKKPAPKPKPKKKSDDGMDVDEDKPKPKPKPKEPSALKPKPKPKESDAMDVDEDRPRPKPKPKKKAEDSGETERPKKKAKTDD
ncbi:FACT complex subunit POB3 [Hypsizygus marmoreus]|uniref:FACT complex subunit POB3 n=1 Tax=Hypsizygus marmoreus TaxID=39966 RepID=A0A369J9B6_HYPMA|nr:FACT complex subunit POB3 [Hypsizygus marmoreus]